MASVTTRLPLSLDNYFALPHSDCILSKSLAAGVAESFTVPDDAKFVLFSSTKDFYADFGTTAVVPGDVTNGTAPELNPTMRLIQAGETAISVISAEACIVTASFYKAI